MFRGSPTRHNVPHIVKPVAFLEVVPDLGPRTSWAVPFRLFDTLPKRDNLVEYLFRLVLSGAPVAPICHAIPYADPQQTLLGSDGDDPRVVQDERLHALLLFQAVEPYQPTVAFLFQAFGNRERMRDLVPETRAAHRLCRELLLRSRPPPLCRIPKSKDHMCAGRETEDFREEGHRRVDDTLQASPQQILHRLHRHHLQLHWGRPSAPIFREREEVLEREEPRQHRIDCFVFLLAHILADVVEAREVVFLVARGVVVQRRDPRLAHDRPHRSRARRPEAHPQHPHGVAAQLPGEGRRRLGGGARTVCARAVPLLVVAVVPPSSLHRRATLNHREGGGGWRPPRVFLKPVRGGDDGPGHVAMSRLIPDQERRKSEQRNGHERQHNCSRRVASRQPCLRLSGVGCRIAPTLHASHNPDFTKQLPRILSDGIPVPAAPSGQAGASAFSSVPGLRGGGCVATP
mmetsp:Transcript_45823/g.108027  ORF Transcript_45823/g.108027 Transcript_45823/m.108027 type:complete len:459 (+) Transcript_45823:152-1528(+)